jgi:hypothetical protein
LNLSGEKEDAALGAKGMGQKARRYGSPQPLMESLVQRVNDRLDLILFIYIYSIYHIDVCVCVWCIYLPSLSFEVFRGLPFSSFWPPTPQIDF